MDDTAHGAPFSIDVTKTERPRPVPEGAAQGFGVHFTDHMFLMDWSTSAGWHGARIRPYGPLSIDPAAGALHYGQAMFEGFKAFRGADGRIRLFRPQRHWARMRDGAERLCMPAVDETLAQAGLFELLRLDRRWVPEAPGSLYVRPTLIATEGFLGVRPAERYTFFVILSPAGSYFAEGDKPVKIWVERRDVRAAPGGLGAVKTGANYAASLAAAAAARKGGYAQVLWLDAVERRYVEEVGTMNLFVKIGDEVITPPLEGTILSGVTRDSILTLLRDWGVPVSERRIALDEIARASKIGTLKEIFGCGTAAVVSPVSALHVGDDDLEVPGPGEVARRLRDELTGIQQGTRPDRHGWMVAVD